MAAPTRTAVADAPLVRELRLWQFTRSLETVFEDVGDGKKYYNRSKNLAEARNLLDRWLLSFQIDYSDKMDKDFPIFPQKLHKEDSVNQKLMDECVEKRFSRDTYNARDIFETLLEEVNSFKNKHRGSSYDEKLEVEYFEEEDGENAEVRIKDPDGGDFKTQNVQRVRFLVRNFGLEASARMLMRYESLGTGSLQWGDPITVRNALYVEAGVRYEGFASPLNSTMLGKKGAHFCSLFFDTDEPFGSLGNFFSVDFSKHPGGWAINPPFIESLMENVADKILGYVENDERSVDNVFFVTFPRWTDTPGYEKLLRSRWQHDTIDLRSGEFTVQCCYGRVFPPRNDLTIFIVSRKSLDSASVSKIKRIFRDTDTEYIKQEWLKNCQIKMTNDQEQLVKESEQQAKERNSDDNEVEAKKEEPPQPVPEYKPGRQLKRFRRRRRSARGEEAAAARGGRQTEGGAEEKRRCGGVTRG